MAATKPLIKECLWLLSNFGVNLTNQTFCGKARSTIGLLIFQILFIDNFLNIIFNWKGVDSMYDLTIFGIALQVLSKLHFITRSHLKLVQMLDIINRFWQVNATHEQINAIYSYMKQVLLFALGVHLFSLTICYVIFILFRRVPVAVYYPKDPTESPHYELIMVFEICFCILCEGGYVAFEYLFFTFITYIYCEFKLIKERISALPHKFDNNKDEKQLLKELGLIIDQHNLLFEFIEMFKNVYSMVIMIIFFSSIFILSASLASMVIKGYGDVLGFLVLILYNLYFLVVLFAYCMGGNVVITASEELLNAIEESNLWLVEDLKFKKALILVMLRSQKVAILKVGGVFDLNLETFTKVVNNAFSFFSLFKATYGNGGRI